MTNRCRILRVDKVMDDFEKHLPKIQERQGHLLKEGAAFLKDFAQCREGMIRPMMDLVGEQLRAKGHDYRIDLFDPVDPEERKFRDAITMAIHLKGLPHFGHGITATPSITYMADALAQMVWLFDCKLLSGYGDAPLLADELKMSALKNQHNMEKQIVDSLDGIMDAEELTPLDREARLAEDEKKLEHMRLFMISRMEHAREQRSRRREKEKFLLQKREQRAQASVPPSQ